MSKTNLKLGHQNRQNVLSFYHLELTPSKCGLCLTWHNRTHCVTSSCLLCCVDICLSSSTLVSGDIWLTQPQLRRITISGSNVADGLPTVNSNTHCVPANVSLATRLHVAGSPVKFTRQMENLPTIGKWRVFISYPPCDWLWREVRSTPQHRSAQGGE